jgi:hypothetical protein
MANCQSDLRRAALGCASLLQPANEVGTGQRPAVAIGSIVILEQHDFGRFVSIDVRLDRVNSFLTIFEEVDQVAAHKVPQLKRHGGSVRHRRMMAR